MAETSAKTLALEIVTPERLLFSGEVEKVTVPGIEGYLGILPGHAPLLSELKIGIISYRQAGEDSHLFCGWGFVEVLPDRVSVLAELVEEPAEIDVEMARADKERALRLLQSKEAGTDYADALLVLERAVTRLEAAQKHLTH